MRIHADLATVPITPKTRIAIHTVSSGTGWRLVVGPHPFGKNGGTRGSLGGKRGKTQWVDGVDVAGSVSGGRDIIQHAIGVLSSIAATGDGDAFLYAMETRSKLHECLSMDRHPMIMEVSRLFSHLGRVHVYGEEAAEERPQ